MIWNAGQTIEPLDPVAAYDSIASCFQSLSNERRRYLESVDALVASHVPPGSQSLLDAGAGTGTRALKIAQAAGLTRLVLLDPSVEMRRLWPATVTSWQMRAEDLREADGQFDVITCLWNVLGHVSPRANRLEALRQFARLLASSGKIFVDVNHRYNARQYGRLKTLGRVLRDRLFPDSRNGDVVVTWNIAGNCYQTSGHVFTHGEFAGMAVDAGLRIERRYVVDYGSGDPRRWAWQGHLLYVLRR